MVMSAALWPNKPVASSSSKATRKTGVRQTNLTPSVIPSRNGGCLSVAFACAFGKRIIQSAVSIAMKLTALRKKGSE
jgi:hypothetical protein